MHDHRGAVAVWTAVGLPAFVIAMGIGVDAPQAIRAAHDYLAGSPFTGSAFVSGDVVTVDVTGSYECQFLSIIGINAIGVSGIASSQVHSVDSDR